jgi:hypothetical protein
MLRISNCLHNRLTDGGKVFRFSINTGSVLHEQRGRKNIKQKVGRIKEQKAIKGGGSKSIPLTGRGGL